MAPLLKELSTLEAEAITIVVDPSELEQERSLNNIVIASGNAEIDALLAGSKLPVNNDNCCNGPPCCCTCMACCCF